MMIFFRRCAVQRFLCYATFFYIIGILTGQGISLPYPLLLSIGILFIYLIKSNFLKSSYDLHIAILLICLIMGNAQYNKVENKFKSVIDAYIDKPISFESCIIKPPIINKDEQTDYIVKLNKISYNNEVHDLPIKIKLTIPNNKKSNKIFNFGDNIEVTGKLRLPTVALNKGSFDYNDYLKSQGIYGVCYANQYQVKKIKGDLRPNIIEHYVFKIQSSVINTINKFLPNNEAALLKALIIGDKSELSPEVRENFAISGLSHVIAVSGMHLTIFIISIGFLLKFFKINKYISHFISIIFIVIFIFVAGSTPSVMRAGIMAIIFLFAYFINKDADTLNSLFISAALILIYNPLILFNAAFQLSFAATLSILIFYKPIYDKIKFLPNSIAKILSASLAAQLGTALITAYHFNSFSIIAILSNIVIVPCISITLISGLMLYLVGNISFYIGLGISGLSFIFLKFILSASKILANIPYAMITIARPSLALIIGYLLFIYILYNLLKGIKSSRKIKLSYLIIIILIISSITFKIWDQQFLEVTFINVGQGDCTFIKCPGNKTLLIDAGGIKGEDAYDIGANVVAPYLINRGQRKIDIAIVSHYHEDHANGILSLMDLFKINNLILPYKEKRNDLMEKLIDRANKNKVPIHYASNGDNLTIKDNIDLQILALKNEYIQTDAINENNKSLLAKLNYNNLSFLFTGDIEKETEKYMLENNYDIGANVLKVAHHGSKTSSTEQFLKKVSPEYAIISVGKNNFGHPSEETLDKLRYTNIKVYRTDLNGTVSFIANKQGIKKIKLFRAGE